MCGETAENETRTDGAGNTFVRRNGQWVPTGGRNGMPDPLSQAKEFAERMAGYSQQAEDRRTQTNRPDINTPFANLNWTKDANGNWTLNAGLGQNVQNLMGRQFDWNQFGELDDGSGAREQTITSAYRDAMSRLQPGFMNETDRLSQQLANQGLSGDSAAAQAARSGMAMKQNDMQSSALARAISEGNRAGSQVFRDNLAARQQRIGEARTAFDQPWEDANRASGLMGMPQFNQSGRAETPNYLGALGMGWNQQNAMREQDMAPLLAILSMLRGL